MRTGAVASRSSSASSSLSFEDEGQDSLDFNLNDVDDAATSGGGGGGDGSRRSGALASHRSSPRSTGRGQKKVSVSAGSPMLLPVVVDGGGGASSTPSSSVSSSIPTASSASSVGRISTSPKGGGGGAAAAQRRASRAAVSFVGVAAADEYVELEEEGFDDFGNVVKVKRKVRRASRGGDGALSDPLPSFRTTSASSVGGDFFVYDPDAEGGIDVGGEEEEEYDDWGNLVVKRRRSSQGKGPSIWDEPAADTPTSDGRHPHAGNGDGRSSSELEASMRRREEIAAAAAEAARRSKRVVNVPKEPGIPLEGDAHVPREMLQLRRHSLFAEMLWNDFYRLCGSAPPSSSNGGGGGALSSSSSSSSLPRLQLVKIPKDVVLMEEGAVEVENGCGAMAFFLTKGLVSVLKDGVHIATLGAGQIVGDDLLMPRAVIDAAPQPAKHGLVTASYCEAWAISQELFQQLSWRKRFAARKPHRL